MQVEKFLDLAMNWEELLHTGVLAKAGNPTSVSSQGVRATSTIRHMLADMKGNFTASTEVGVANNHLLMEEALESLDYLRQRPADDVMRH